MLAARSCSGEEELAERPRATPAPTATPTEAPTAAPTRTPAPKPRGPRGELAVGLTEPNPNLLWPPNTVAGVAPQFSRWQPAAGRLRPRYYRLVLDWAALQPSPGRRADLVQPQVGCMRQTPPCNGWAGVRDQLAAVAARQAQQPGAWRVLAVLTGTPDWAARPPSGCERPETAPRSRAPRPAALAAYRRLVGDTIAVGAEFGVEVAYWSAWNEPNHPYFLSPQRAVCSAASPSLAAARYAELVRALRGALADTPGRQRYVLGELAGLDESKARSASVREFIGALPRDLVCGTRILSQHGYITGADPVDDATGAARAHRCPRRHEVWMTETGVGAPHAGEDKRTTPAAERRACVLLHRRLLRWYRDRRVTAAFQYTFREDDLFRTGLVTTGLGRAFPVLRAWQAWGGTARPSPTDPPPSGPRCAGR